MGLVPWTMSTASFISAFAATMLVVGVVFVALSSDVHTQTAVSSNQERPTGKPFQQMASTELFVGSCEDAIIAVHTTATAITTGIVAAYAECAAEAFNFTGKHDTKKCVEGLELACATTASQIAALGALKATCTDSLPSLGCGKSLTLALEASSTLTATCATTLTTCGNLRAVDPCGLPRVGIGIYPGDFFGARSRLSGRPCVQQLQRPTRATYRPGQQLQRGFHSEPCRVQSVRAGHKLLLERFGRFEAGAQLDLLSSKSRRVIATRSGYGGNYRLRHPTILLPRGSHRCSALRHRSTVAADRLLQVHWR